MELSFTHPQYLVLLFLIPIIIFVHFFAIKMTRKNAIKFSNFDAIARIKGVDMFSKNVVILFLSSIIFVLLILSISGLTVVLNLSSSKFSYVIAIDSSESMLADDLSPNRLEYAKQNAVDFVKELPFGTKVGVISFSGNAIVEKRATNDKGEIVASINNIKATEIGGTDISEALVTSTNLLIDETFRSIIILSDGQINTGKIDQAIDYAIRNQVVIHTIGVGTVGGGQTTYGISKLDEDSLRSVAYNTKGTYTNMQEGDFLSVALDNIITFDEVDVAVETSRYLVILSLLLLLLEFILINTRYRMYP